MNKETAATLIKSCINNQKNLIKKKGDFASWYLSFIKFSTAPSRVKFHFNPVCQQNQHIWLIPQGHLNKYETNLHYGCSKPRKKTCIDFGITSVCSVSAIIKQTVGPLEGVVGTRFIQIFLFRILFSAMSLPYKITCGWLWTWLLNTLWLVALTFLPLDSCYRPHFH